MNPSSWPVLCMVYCWMLTDFNMSNNERLRRCHPSAAVLPWLNTLLPITIITFFALVHDNSNIFFLNASNLGYRMLEFNLGICFYAALQNHPITFWKFAAVGTHKEAEVFVAVVELFVRGERRILAPQSHRRTYILFSFVVY